MDVGAASGRVFDLDGGEHFILFAVVGGFVAEGKAGFASISGVIGGQLVVKFFLLPVLFFFLLGLFFPFLSFLLFFFAFNLIEGEMALVAVFLDCVGEGVPLEGLGLVVFSGSFQ